MYGKHVAIVHGDAPDGADRLADEVAWDLGLAIDACPANWKRYGKDAGMMRNTEMLESNVVRVVAFWDGKSPGTLDSIKKARQMGIPVCIIYPKGS